MGTCLFHLYPPFHLECETDLMRNLALALLLTLPALGQQTVTVLPDVGSLYVYDGTSRLVGAFTPAPVAAATGPSIDGVIRLEVLGEGTLYLPIARINGKLVWSAPEAYYTTSDCSGTAHASFTRSVADLIGVVGPKGQLYIGSADAKVNVKQYFFRSKVSVNAEGNRICKEFHTQTGVAIELREVANLDTLFPPPLSLSPGGKARAVGPR